jgi:hypothetical protein
VVLGAIWLAFTLSAAPAGADTVQVRAGAPDRYTVTKGDTLWSIANRFLEDPWRWPEIWQQNPGVENPHLIYPGDVLVLTGTEDGQPAVKALRGRKITRLKPEIRVTDRDGAIPTIPPDAIQPFLTNPLVIEEGGLDHAGYVAAGEEGAIVLGKYNVFFAKGIDGADSDYYNLFRPGRVLVHPETDEFLGQQAIHLGEARVLAAGDTAKMEITDSTQEIGLGDRMVVADENIALPYYQPSAPDREVNGYVLDIAGAVAEGGPLQTIVVSLGAREGMQQGHVLRIQRTEADQEDPVTGGVVEIPPQDSGLAIVYRVFEKVSYALVLEATRSIHMNDRVTNP